MATISITTTADQDAAVKAATDKYNASSGEALTPIQYAKQRIDQFMRGILSDYQDEMRITKVMAYKNATPTDQATIDTILAKYQ